MFVLDYCDGGGTKFLRNASNTCNLHNIPSQKNCDYCNNLIWPVGARMMVKLNQKPQEVSKYRNLTARCACGVKIPSDLCYRKP
jgi:hypothetical protein